MKSPSSGGSDATALGLSETSASLNEGGMGGVVGEPEEERLGVAGALADETLRMSRQDVGRVVGGAVPERLRRSVVADRVVVVARRLEEAEPVVEAGRGGGAG